MAIEIVSFPINSMVIFHSYVSLPEGKNQPFILLLPFCLHSDFNVPTCANKKCDQAPNHRMEPRGAQKSWSLLDSLRNVEM